MTADLTPELAELRRLAENANAGFGGDGVGISWDDLA